MLWQAESSKEERDDLKWEREPGRLIAVCEFSTVPLTRSGSVFGAAESGALFLASSALTATAVRG
jgi:hypothetical protein